MGRHRHHITALTLLAVVALGACSADDDAGSDSADARAAATEQSAEVANPAADPLRQALSQY